MGRLEALRPELLHLKEAYLEKSDAWDQAFFDQDVADQKALEAADKERLSAARRLHSFRTRFAGQRSGLISSVHHDFHSIEQLTDWYPQDAAEFEALFVPDATQANVQRSVSIEAGGHRKYWIRFNSPSKFMNDVCHARVMEPTGVENPATLVFGHGFGVDFDLWNSKIDFVDDLVGQGIRVIRPEAAWHGRRTPDGYYGGERLISGTPRTFIEFFIAQHLEWAVLIDWARSTGSGIVAVGGSSLGAQTAQMYSVRSATWDKRFRPDAALLLAHCSRTSEVALDGKLADVWGLHEPMSQLGWTHETIETWLRRVDPIGSSGLSGHRVVSVLGRSDEVTPFLSGCTLQNDWNIPQDNRFHWPTGHFGMPMRLLRDAAPINRFLEVLDEIKNGQMQSGGP